MGSYSPVPGFGRDAVEEMTADGPPADRRPDAPSRHALPRGPLRGPDADRRRARRCSSSTAASATPRRRPCCRGCARTWPSSAARRASPAASPAPRRVLRRLGGDAWCSPRPAIRPRRSKGDVITGLDAAAALDGVEVTHAGTAERDGEVVTAGGRVLNVTGARAHAPSAARERAYEAAEPDHVRRQADANRHRRASGRAGRRLEARASRAMARMAARRGGRAMEIAEPRRVAHRPPRRRCPRSRPRSRRSRSTPRWSGSSWARRTTSRRCSPPGQALHEAGIRYEVRVMSAHRDPEKVRDYCHQRRGCAASG